MRTVSMRRFGALALFLAAAAAPAFAQVVGIAKIGGYDSGLGEGAAEISAYDAGSQRLFVVNAVAASIDVLNLAQPTAPVKVGELDVTPWGAVANSVDAYGGLVAVAVQADPKTAPGKVVFFSAQGVFLKAVEVGALPDMVTFTPDGKAVLVANEGEPSDDYTVDPEGSVSLIDLSGGVAAATVFSFRFDDFNLGGPRAGELPTAIRIYGPGASVAQDLEPEYIAVAADGKKAWVTLQENNGLAILDLAGRRVEGIASLGFKNYMLPGNTLDPSDRDGGTHLGNWPVFGMYQPDAIAAYQSQGQTLLLTANEGDARAWTGFVEETRVGDLTLDPQAFPNAAALQQDAALKRLRTTTAFGDLDGDGDHDRIYAFGARSFSIWRGDVGSLVYDSGDDIEKATLELGSFVDSRSDDKGPEPEGLTIGEIDGRHYAFVGLERTSDVLVYDISNPLKPQRVAAVESTGGDESPEGVELIPAASSPNGKNLLVASHEVSGTIAVFEVETKNPGNGTCSPSANRLCLGGGRFAVTATYKTLQGETGAGRAIDFTNDSGYFYFFDAGNVELVVKVLDACAAYQQHWVFVSGLTNLQVDVTVTDTRTGTQRTYKNSSFLPFQPVLDYVSFNTCP